MRHLTKIISVMLVLTLMLTLTACAESISRADNGVAEIQEAAAPGLFQGRGAGRDSTAFLVGEFDSGSGTKTRFDGFGTITIVQADGSAVVGSYSMTEYENRDAVVSIEMNGVSTEYSFDLSSANGSFCLTDRYDNAYSFSPVAYGN